MTKKNNAKKTRKPPRGKKGGTGNTVQYRGGPAFSRAALGLPSAKMVQMRYVETISQTSTVGSLASYEWSANDLFDPNITGAGHQPYGFDNWMALYQKATVIRSQAKIEVASSGVPLMFGITFARGAPTGTITTAVSLIESGRGTGHLVSGSSAPVKQAESNFDLHITDPDFDPGSFFCTVSASPTFRYHYSVFSQPADLSSTVSMVGFIVIDYDVLLEDPNILAPS